MAKVQLFVTCLVDSFAPDVGEAVVDVLERHGCTVEFPFDQTCCGQPAFNVGDHDQAKTMAEHTIRLLDATEGTIGIFMQVNEWPISPETFPFARYLMRPFVLDADELLTTGQFLSLIHI